MIYDTMSTYQTLIFAVWLIVFLQILFGAITVYVLRNPIQQACIRRGYTGLKAFAFVGLYALIIMGCWELVWAEAVSRFFRR